MQSYKTDSPSGETSPPIPPTAMPPPYYAPLYGMTRTHSLPALGEISVARLLRVVRKKMLILCVVPAIALLIAVGYLLTATRIYRAQCTLEMSQMRPRIMGQRSAVIDDGDGARRTDDILVTRLQKLKGPSVIDRAVSNIVQRAEAKPYLAGDIRRILEKNYYMRLIRSTRLVCITFDHADREFAKAVVESFTLAVESFVAEESKSASDSAVAWLEAQALLQRAALEKDDEILMQFDKENQIDAMQREKTQIEGSLKGFGDVLTQIESQQSLAMDLCSRLAALHFTPGEAGRIPEAMPRAKEIEALVEQLSVAVSKRDELQTKYTPKHPEVAAQEEVIRSIIRRAKEAAESNLALLKQQSESLRHNIQKQRQQATELEQKIVERTTRRTTLERSRDASDMSYKGVLNRIQEARLSADENTATIKVVERARLPDAPISPSVMMPLMWALALGLFAGLGLALYTDTLDDLVTTAEDVERDLELKIIGIIPHVPAATDRATYAAGMAEASTPLSEAFAGVRGLLDSRQYAHVSRSVLVTSTAPGEGKSVAACNLAISSAKSGRRTLLIDLDLRRPRVAKALELTGQHTDMRQALLSKDAKMFEQMMEKGICPCLDVIANRNPVRLGPADIIGGESMRDFINWAVAEYDRVIIDSPPFGIVGDSAVLGALTGSVILVCRPNVTRKRALKHVSRHFRDVGANVIGVIVNHVDIQRGFRFSSFEHYGAYSYETTAAETAG